MNRNITILTVGFILAIIVGFLIYNLTDNNQERANINETTQNLVEISKDTDISDGEVTDECINEWADYNEYIGEKIEEASNNFAENDTRYLIKDVLGYIEVYYLDENGQEYLYKKTDISTEYLSQEDVDDLKVGIEVVGAEALNKMLEDFE